MSNEWKYCNAQNVSPDFCPNKSSRKSVGTRTSFIHSSIYSLSLVIKEETRWNLKCLYPRRKTETVKYQARSGFKDVEEVGEIPTEMMIFETEKYIRPLPEPISFNLGQKVYVEV